MLKSEFKVEELENKSQLIFLDAHKTLELFMRDGLPNGKLFKESMGQLLSKTSVQFPLIRTYGEMVNILWGQGNKEATILLENQWNHLQQTYNFSLLCGYLMSQFENEADSQAFSEVCGCHSHVHPDESYISQAGDTDQYRRLIAELHQRNLALQNEINQRKALEKMLDKLKNRD